jgi:outer membrane protein TolC
MVMDIKRPCNPLQIGFLLLISLSNCLAVAEQLSLADYLVQVSERNPGSRSAEAMENAASKLPSQASLLTLPRLKGDASYLNDRSPVLFPDFTGKERIGRRFQLGIDTQTDIGLNASVFYFNDQQVALGAALIPSNQNSLALSGTGAELSLSFLKNSFGRDIKLQKLLIRADAAAKGAQARLDRQMLLIKAERTYFAVARLQEENRMRADLVSRGISLLAWAKKRVDLRLLDPAEAAQAEAALGQRKLELVQQQIRLSELVAQFQVLRQESFLEPIPLLSPLHQISPHLGPKDPGHIQRIDSEVVARSAEAEGHELALKREEYRPDLKIVSRYLAFNRGSQDNDSQRCVSIDRCGQFSVALNLSIPIAIPMSSTVQLGLEQAAEAKRLSAEQIRVESMADYHRIQGSVALQSRSIWLAEQVLRSQEQRLLLERQRQKQGRATTFDILRAEQDHFTAKLAWLDALVLRLENSVELRLYEEVTE